MEKTFNFVNTNPWVELSSKDKAYTIKIGPNYTYGYCQGDQETTMVGMIYMNQSGVYDCNSVTTALSTSNASLPLTRIAFGIATDSSTRGNVKPLRVTILNGVNAERYEYMDTVNDKSYRHIEYIVLHKGKEYTAHMQWEDGYDLSSGSNISLDTFDTIAQKTWKFN